MFEFIETYLPNGAMIVYLSTGKQLPKAMSCQIMVYADGKVIRRTHPGAKPGIRYAPHANYAEAQAAAIVWAKRKIKEAQK